MGSTNAFSPILMNCELMCWFQKKTGSLSCDLMLEDDDDENEEEEEEEERACVLCRDRVMSRRYEK